MKDFWRMAVTVYSAFVAQLASKARLCWTPPAALQRARPSHGTCPNASSGDPEGRSTKFWTAGEGSLLSFNVSPWPLESSNPENAVKHPKTLNHLMNCLHLLGGFCSLSAT